MTIQVSTGSPAVFRTHTLTTQSQSAGSRRRSKQFSLFFCVSTVRSNASPQQENLHFYSVLLSSCEFSKSAFGIYCIFPVFYHLFKEKFDIFVTVKSDSAIFWASTEKAKFFVRIPSLYFYSGRLRRYSVWSLHCSSLASKDSVFKAQLSIAVTRLTAKCFISKFAASQFVTRSSSVPSLFLYLQVPSRYSVSSRSLNPKALHVAGLSVLLVLILLPFHLRHFCLFPRHPLFYLFKGI